MTTRLETARVLGWAQGIVRAEGLLDRAEQIARLSRQRADLVIAMDCEPDLDSD